MPDWSGEVKGPVIMREDATVVGTIKGDVMVLAGAALQLAGVVTGDLMVEIGGRAVVRGTVWGCIRNRGGHVHLYGAAEALVDAAAGAVTIIEPGARLKGGGLTDNASQ